MAGIEIKRLLFLCSGGGGNLAFFQKAIECGILPGARIVGVLTDRECQAKNFAARMNLPNRILNFGDPAQHEVLAALDELQPDLVITTVHKILRPALVEGYRGRLINLHYSLLPAFAGLIGAQAVQAAIDYPARFTGVTVHFVDENLDAGIPLVQGVIPLQNEESLPDLMQIVFRSGCLALLGAISSLLTPLSPPNSCYSMNVLNRTCTFNGGPTINEELAQDEDFWGQLRQALEK